MRWSRVSEATGSGRGGMCDSGLRPSRAQLVARHLLPERHKCHGHQQDDVQRYASPVEAGLIVPNDPARVEHEDIRVLALSI